MTLGHMHACSVVTVMSDSATQWIIACQAPLSIGFARQEIWSRLLSPPPGDLPNSGIEPMSPALQADSLPTKLPGRVYICGVGGLLQKSDHDLILSFGSSLSFFS